MRAICAWCKSEIEPTGGAELPGTSHGICARCADLLEQFDQHRLGTFLDGILHPVLCVDDDVRVVFGNRAAADALGRDPLALRGQLGGEILECVHAREPAGCGRTDSCPACVIRGSVDKTYATGEPVRHADAWQDLFTPAGVRRQHLLVSTEKSGRFVLLHIDQDQGCAV